LVNSIVEALVAGPQLALLSLGQRQIMGIIGTGSAESMSKEKSVPMQGRILVDSDSQAHRLLNRGDRLFEG
jgi:hypothetical protein